MASPLDFLKRIPSSINDAYQSASNYVSEAKPISPKKQEVLTASQKAKAELQRLSTFTEARVSRAGYNNRKSIDPDQSEQEKDFNTLSPWELEQKYGKTVASTFIRNRNAAERELYDNALSDRSGKETSDDIIYGALQGLANTANVAGMVGSFQGRVADAISGALGGPNDLGSRFANPAAKIITDKVNEYNEFIEGKKSNQYKDARVVFDAREEADSRINDLISNRETAANPDQSAFKSDLRKAGREFIASGGNILKSPEVTTDLLGNVIGSLAGAKGIAGGITATGRVIEKAIPNRIATNDRFKKALEKYAGPASMVGGIALQETGGTFGSTLTEAYDFLDNDPATANLDETQKLKLANDTAQEAALKQLPVAVAASLVVAKFEKNIFKNSRGLGNVAKNTGKEGFEESIQSASSTLAQNSAIQNNIDPTREVMEGVGKSTAEGLIGGIGAGGGLSLPGSAANVVVDAAKATDKLLKTTSERIGKLNTGALKNVDFKGKMESLKNVRAPANLAIGEKITALKDSISDYVNNFLPENAEPDDTPDYMRDVLSNAEFDKTLLDDLEDTNPIKIMLGNDVTNKFDAMNTLSVFIQTQEDAKTPEDIKDREDAAFMLTKMFMDNKDLINSEIPNALNKHIDDHPAAKQIQEFVSLIQATTSDPFVLESIKKAASIIDESIAAEAQAETQVDASAPVTQKEIDRTAVKADISPLSLDPDRLDVMAKQESSGGGNFRFNQKQREWFQKLATVIRKVREESKLANATGLPQVVGDISGDVLTNVKAKGEKGPNSVVEHMQAVARATKRGDGDATKRALENMAGFAQAMQNKVDALNRSFDTFRKKADNDPNPFTERLPFESWNSKTRKPYTDKKNVIGVTVTSAKSIEFAQKIALEAEAVARTFNALNSQYNLGVKDIVPVNLDPRLAQRIPKVVKDIKDKIAEREANAKGISNETTKQETKTETKEEQAPVEEKPADIEQAPVDNVSDKVTEALEKAEAVPTISAEQAAKLSDEKLNDLLNDLIDKKADKTITGVELANFAILDAEMNKREDQAAADLKAEKAEEESAEEATSQKTWNGVLVTPSNFNGMKNNEFKIKDYWPMMEFFFITSNGVRVAGSFIFKNNWFQDFSITSELGKNKVGIAVISRVLRELRKAYPSAKGVYGWRQSGARSEAAYVSQDFNTAKAKAEEDKEKAIEEVVEEPTSEPKTIDEYFPNMLKAEGQDKSWFAIAYKLPKEIRNRIYAAVREVSATAAQIINEAISNPSTFREFVGETGKTLTPEIAADYNQVLKMGNNIKVNLEKRLATQLNSKLGEKGGKTAKTTLQDELLSGRKPINRWLKYRHLNLTNLDDNGNLVYNPELLDLTVTAALHFLVNFNALPNQLTDKQIASTLGITEAEVSQDIRNAMSKGVTPVILRRNLADTIERFWGFSPNRNTTDSLSKALKEAMALEVLAVLQDTNLLEVKQAEVNTIQKPNLYKLRRSKNDPNKSMFDDREILKYPNALEDLVSVDPEVIYHINEPPKKVLRTQGKNRLVGLSQQSIDAIDNEQQTPHYANNNVIGWYNALGESGILKLHGEEDLETRPLNLNHKKSLEGKNLSLVSAYRTLSSMVGQIENVAESEQVPREQVPIYFEYTMSSVLRMQMQGPYNPQSSKVTRVAIASTNSVVDLSDNGNAQHKLAFNLSLAQAMGIKIHNLSHTEALSKLSKALNALPKTLAILTNFLEDGKPITDDNLNIILSEFPSGKPTEVQMASLLEYARLDITPDAEKAEFETQMFVEADGVSNGLANAMQVLTTRPFNQQSIANSAKTGLFYTGQTSLADNVSKDPKDVYQSLADSLQVSILSKLTDRNAPQEAIDITKALLDVMSLVMDDITFNEAALSIERGLIKNPSTITIYGSGARGIAGNITDELFEKLYERFSATAERIKENNSLNEQSAMFYDVALGDTKEAINLYNKYSQNMRTLMMNKLMYRDKKGTLKLTDRKYIKDRKTFNYNTDNKDKLTGFTFSELDRHMVQSNILIGFVEPLTTTISQTLGSSMLDNADLIQRSTQIMGLMMQNAFFVAYDKVMKERSETDPLYHNGDLLSENEVAKILKSLKKVYPDIESKYQNLSVSTTERADIRPREVDGKAQSGNPYFFAKAVDDRFESPAYVNGPRDPGVAGIPYSVISIDGLMMQILATMPNAPEGTTKIFDGVHMKLTTMFDDSVKANEAAYLAWTEANPLEAISKAFDTFIENYSAAGISDVLLNKIVRSIGFDNPDVAVIDSSGKLPALKNIQRDLKEQALIAKARQNVLKRVKVTVDQMASIGAPFTSDGEIELSTDPAEAAAELNVLLVEELDKLRPVSDTKPLSENIDKNLARWGYEHTSGARVYDYDAIKSMVRGAKIPAGQKQLLNRIIKNNDTRGYKVVFGSKEQLLRYSNRTARMFTDNNGEIKGFADLKTNTVYLLNPTSETLLHELLHVTSFDLILDYYEGGVDGNKLEIGSTIRRIEMLMDQFLKIEDTFELDLANEKTKEAFYDAKNAITGALNNTNMNAAQRKALALNEFMAWVLANKELTTLTKRFDANPLVLLAKRALRFINKLIFGRDVPVKPGQDLFSNLKFNSEIIIEAQKSTLSKYSDTVGLQSSSYGSDPRITKLDQMFRNNMIKYGLQDRSPRGAAARSEVSLADAAALKVQRLFSMNFKMSAQEKTTFETMVAMLGTASKLDANVLNKMQELYSHVEKNLTVEDFISSDPNLSDLQKRYDAQEKYDTLMGNKGIQRDKYKRTSLLPAFIGLATVNESFREILKGMEVPKREKGDTATFDDVAGNFGTSVLDAITNTATGVGFSLAKANNIQEALDILVDRLAEITLERESYFDRASNGVSNVVNKANDIFVENVNKGAAALNAKSKATIGQSNNRAIKAIADVIEMTTAIVNEDIAAKVAEDYMSVANRTNMSKSLYNLFNELVGRTESNAAVYDLIKRVRSMVQKLRQQYRQEVPVVIASKFSKPVTDNQWSSMFFGLAKTDIAAISTLTNKTFAEIRSLLLDPSVLATEISNAEEAVQALDRANINLIKQKAKELADYMVTGKMVNNFLRNPVAVAGLFNEGVKRGDPPTNLVNAVDLLTTYYAIERFNDVYPEHRNTLQDLSNSEATGVEFVIAYLKGQRSEELRKVTSPYTRQNYYKGYVPNETDGHSSVIIVKTEDNQKYLDRGYVLLGPYRGSSNEPGNTARSYFYTGEPSNARVNQGILQTIQHTASGVDLSAGNSSNMMTAGRIWDPETVEATKNAIRSNPETGNEILIPIFLNGKVFAYERTVNKEMTDKIPQNTNLGQLLGNWRGRQVEEYTSNIFNDELLRSSKAMWEKDKNTPRRAEYINLFQTQTDPVIKDMVNLIPNHIKEQAAKIFGQPKTFLVRKDLLEDTIGYRSASIGDFWTEGGRWSEDTKKQVRQLAQMVFGKDAYQTLVKAERLVQSVVIDAKLTIVIKSVIVPMANFMSNILQLISRGVPLGVISKQLPKKLAEVESYVRTDKRHRELEAELRAVENDLVKSKQIKDEMSSIKDQHRRMTIWPLIQSGEFSSISDAAVSRDEVRLVSGKLNDYIEGLVEKMPDSVKTAGKYAIVSRDTAMFKGLQKAIEYGDFLGKAVLYDHLVNNKKQTNDEALGHITEEFVNYDRLAGRTRSYLESMGLLWFWHFKIRSVKVALSMIRNNPLQTLIASQLPTPPMLSSVGMPIDDNLMTVILDDRIGYSLGPGQGLRAVFLNPWYNLFH